MSNPQVKLQRIDDKRRYLMAVPGPELPSVTGGIGGFAQVARPRKQSMTEWVGPGARTATVQLLFDGWLAQKSVQPQLDYLRTHFAPVDPPSEPPRFTVHACFPIPSTVSWVVEDVTLNSFEVRASDRAPLRVLLTLSLLQYVAGDVVVRTTATQRAATGRSSAGSKSAATKRTYTVRSGDTLSKVAAAQLGDHRRWTEIAALNGIRDPNRLTVGAKLKLP